jgi:hypothetical protein
MEGGKILFRLGERGELKGIKVLKGYWDGKDKKEQKE